jgi:hypothetical protein
MIQTGMTHMVMIMTTTITITTITIDQTRKALFFDRALFFN